MNVTNYDPRKVSVVVDGRIVTGFADSSMITIARSEDIVSTSVGTQGDVVYSESANRSGTLTMSLQSTSASLVWLKNIAKSRKEISVVITDASQTRRGDKRKPLPNHEDTR